jgi:hypothetical protein
MKDAEETLFVTETHFVLCDVRTEAEEQVEHRASNTTQHN